MIALVTGIALRAWFLFHLPLTSDQAIVGLMAKQFLHGHMNAFYWGQAYGGVEPHLVAVAFAVAGHSAVTLNLVATALAAIAALLVWRITLRFVDDRRLAALAGALAWAAPLPAVYKSTIEYGFRGAALACGLAVVLVSVRILDHRDRVLDFVALGGFVGLGWWASPEIVYFLLPAALLLGGAIARGGRDGAWWLRRLSAGDRGVRDRCAPVAVGERAVGLRVARLEQVPGIGGARSTPATAGAWQPPFGTRRRSNSISARSSTARVTTSVRSGCSATRSAPRCSSYSPPASYSARSRCASCTAGAPARSR